LRTYTLKQVSKKIQVSTSTIKQWEKDLFGLLEIPRSKQGTRLYTSVEINQLLEIHQLYKKNLSVHEIRQILEKGPEPQIALFQEETDPALVSEEVMIPPPSNEISIRNTEFFFAAMDQYKETFLNEVKNEITKVVKTEIVGEVKKEISKNTLQTMKNISDSIYKSSENTIDEIKELSFTIQKTSHDSNETFKLLERSLSDQSLETAEEFFTLAKQLSQTSDELAHSIDVTNNEISNLAESLEKEREYFLEDRAQFRHEIKQRELAFQSMLVGFRDAAATKEKKWWRFWQSL
jgi:DNA-binding transcriptional MerR regulator